MRLISSLSLRFAWNNGALGDRIFPDIQAELSFARLLVRAVTMKAIIREDGPDVPIVADLLRPRRRKRQEEREAPGANGEKVFQRFHAKYDSVRRINLLTPASILINSPSKSRVNRSVSAGKAPHSVRAVVPCGSPARTSDAPYPLH